MLRILNNKNSVINVNIGCCLYYISKFNFYWFINSSNLITIVWNTILYVFCMYFVWDTKLYEIEKSLKEHENALQIHIFADTHRKVASSLGSHTVPGTTLIRVNSTSHGEAISSLRARTVFYPSIYFQWLAYGT